MRYFSEAKLQELGERPLFESFSHIKTASSQARVTIFLSHSHHDRNLVRGLIRYLEKLGISLYVDWNDSSMPAVTNCVTAAKLKQRIKGCSLFMVLATRNALNSKWVPWEVGIADQMKGEAAVSVIAVADPSGKFDGAEYLQLYQLVAFPDVEGPARMYAAETRAAGPSLVEYLQWGV
jgi:hypothetical protein